MDINNLKLSDLNVFNHTNYTNDRETKSTLIFDSGSESLPISSQVFTKTLEADFIIDNKSDVYLDSLTTFNCKPNTDTNSMGFLIKIDEFNQSSNISNDSKINNCLFIPNESKTSSLSVVHKGKKLNYVCSVNPMVLSSLKVTLSDLNGASAFGSNGNGRFILDLLFINSE